MRLLMSMFGWRDSGGGTIFPRQLAQELVRRGHEVLVIYAAAPSIPGAPLYTVQEHSDEGVQLVGIHNRPAFFLDDQHPEREVHDPQIVRIFRHYFELFQPDLVHYHNFLGLSMGIADLAWEAGLPSFYTPYNFWLLCPTLYLNLPNLALCRGVNANGRNCLTCTQAPLSGERYLLRRDTLQAHYRERVGLCLATSQCVKTLMVENGYAPEQIEILKLGNERAVKIWQERGEKRKPGVHARLRIGFTGAVLPIKGAHTLVEAAQYLQGDFEILIYGEGPPDYLQQIKALDRKGCVTFAGRFEDAEHSALLCQLDLGVVPSICYDHSPLVIGEFQAARVPVIGAEIGGIPDYLQLGTGALYPVGNARALAAQLQALIDDPSPILRWQALMQAPLSFADYVTALERRYAQALVKGAHTREQHRLERFLKLRRPQWRYYDAQTLAPLVAPQAGCGIDLSMADEADLAGDAELQQILSQAAWLILPDAAQGTQRPQHFLQWLPASLPRVVLPPPFPGFWPAPSVDLPTEQPVRLLLFFELGSAYCEDWLWAYLKAYNAASEIALMILPLQGSLEAAQNALIDWMEAAGFNSESGPEMVLIHADDFGDPETWAGHFQAILWDPLLMASVAKRSCWQRGPSLLPMGTAETKATEGTLAGWESAAWPASLQPLQAHLPQAQFVLPRIPSAAEFQLQVSRLKTLLQGATLRKPD